MLAIAGRGLCSGAASASISATPPRLPMDSTNAGTSEAYDPCDYILCVSNLLGAESASKFLHVKKCAGCNSARYCSKACQKKDWTNHKIWCCTHKTNHNEDNDDWQQFHRQLYAWRRTHFDTLKDAFIASIDLRNNPDAIRQLALGLFVTYKPHSTGPTCMRLHHIELLSYTGGEARQYAAPRAEYEKQFAQRIPKGFYGAGMVVVHIKHAADPEGETLYAVPIPVTTSEASLESGPGMGELLALRLLKGLYFNPETDIWADDLYVSMLNRNTAHSLEAPQKWSWTRTDEEEMAADGTRVFTLEELLDKNFLPTFDYQLTSIRRATAVNNLQHYIAQIATNIPLSSQESYMTACHSRMISMLDLSRPSRLHEAEPSFRILFAMPEAAGYMEQHTYQMFLFVNCLASIPGKEDEALGVLDRAMQIRPKDPESELTTRGYLSRMLRRANRIAEAEEYEEKTARWILGLSPHEYTVTKVCELLRDPNNSHAKNYILDHPFLHAWRANGV